MCSGRFVQLVPAVVTVPPPLCAKPACADILRTPSALRTAVFAAALFLRVHLYRVWG